VKTGIMVKRYLHNVKSDKAYQAGLSSSTSVFRHCPESASHIRLEFEVSVTQLITKLIVYIRPSIAHDTIRVPS
jgi:hypothetical protein